MNKVLRIGIIAICLGFIFSSISVSEAKAQNILGEILSRMDKYNKSLQSLKADVTMVKYNPQLNVSDTTVGTTSYLPKTAKRSLYARIDWTKPVEEQISVIGDSYELYRPRLNQVIYGKTQKAQGSPKAGNLLSFMNMSKEQLKANYDVVYIGEEQIQGAVKTWHIQLTPKVQSGYKFADMWIDGDGTPRQAKVTEKNNDTTTLLISNIQKNVTLSASLFKLNYPKSVKRVAA
jgi:outer membrane lipoprotein-sorting protein